jgi:SAM-dependent methyltransferase
MSRASRVLVFLGCALLVGAAVPQSGCARRSDAPESEASTDTATAEKGVAEVTEPQSEVVHKLRMAGVAGNKVVYDLGSGDGRFVITAAQQFGARAVGVEIDPDLVRQARSEARLAGVSDRVEFRQGDLFDVDLHEASVVTLYLEPGLNLKLRPKLLLQLDPGDRVVSHDFNMGTWTPDRVEKMDGSTLYLWTVPDQVPDELGR